MSAAASFPSERWSLPTGGEACRWLAAGSQLWVRRGAVELHEPATGPDPGAPALRRRLATGEGHVLGRSGWLRLRALRPDTELVLSPRQQPRA